MSTIIAFTKVNLPYGWMGNMSPYPIKYGDSVYKTTEALFQSLRFDDPDIIKMIREQKSPMAAKAVAKNNKEFMVIKPTGKKDAVNMLMVLRLKLEQHPELKEQLLQTGEAVIIEDCTSRPIGSGLYWGAALQNGEWVGKNILGNLWMILRNELK